MNRWSPRWRIALAVGSSTVAAFLLYRLTLAPGLTWAHNGADGGDLATAVALNGVPHPTGYPTYLALGALFARLPWGDIAFRLNLLSATTAALTVGIVAWSTALLARSEDEPPALLALMAGGVLATSRLLWSQAVITEVYSLHALFVALLAALTLRHAHTLLSPPSRPAAQAPTPERRPALPNPRPATRNSQSPTRNPRSAIRNPQSAIRNPFLTALTLGLGLGNHVSLVLLLPGLVWAVGGLFYQPRSRAKWHLPVRHLVQSYLVPGTLGLALGLSAYLLLPLRARQHPPVNWGGADTWAGFWWLVSGRLYRHFLDLPRWATLWTRVTQLAAVALAQFGPWGLALISWAMAGQLRPLAARYLRLTLWGTGVYALWALMYGVSDWKVYTLPIWVLLAPWVALGVAAAVRTAGRPRWAVVGLLLPLVAGVQHWGTVDLHGDRQAQESARVVWASIPPGALVLTDGDRATFTLGYTHLVRGDRPDLRVINRTMWAYPWYRDGLQRWYGDLVPPTGPVHLGAVVAAHSDRPLYLVGDTLPGGFRLTPNGPYYRVERVPLNIPLAVGKVTSRE